jgi:carbon-monoxide dehydrogenase medium subunit
VIPKSGHRFSEKIARQEKLTMKPAPFIRHVPRTVAEAVKILAEVAPQDGRVLAGGQSLVPIMAFRLAKPAHLVDINEIEELGKVASDGKVLAIGACVRHAAFRKPVTEGPLGALLCDVARHIAHLPIRNRGTFCGSLAHADPASEWCLVAATLGATLVARSTRGERLIAAEDFFQGIMTTALDEDELLAEVRLPLLPADAKFGFNEFNRRAGDFAMSAALVTYRLQDGNMTDVHVGVGGAEPAPRRLADAEAALNDETPGDKTFRAAAAAAAKAVDAMEDHQTTADYRRDLVRAVVRRALEHSTQ